MNYGWAGTIHEFLRLSYEELEKALMLFIYDSTDLDAVDEDAKKVKSQQFAWRDSFVKLQDLLKEFEDLEGSVIFEYAILRGSGRRPDILLLLPGNILVIECKSYNEVNAAEYVQTSLYVRDLQEYHSIIQAKELRVRGVLFLTNDNSDNIEAMHEYSIYQASQKGLRRLLEVLMKTEGTELIGIEDILTGVFQPSPSMLEAAESIFNHEPLPRVKAIDSSNFEEVYNTVHSVIDEAKVTNTHHLILVSGEPGSGKTFLGLQIAHDITEAIYLSGNGPLVDVLQDTLKNETFVQSLYGFKQDFLRFGKTPNEKVIIFDEAQRAWDAERMEGPLSEPDVIMQIAKKKPWGVVIALVGDGQEIHLGEESGLKLWNQAINGQNVTVHAKHENKLFQHAKNYQQHEHLHLDSSLRSHTALEYHNFVNFLLDGNIKETQKLMEPLRKDRYPLFITDSLAKAKTYLSKLYLDDVKTYGLVCASGTDSKKDMRVLPFPKRYDHPNSAQAYFNYPEHPYYCKNMEYMATEFQIQGLELDMAVVHWDEDFYWQGNQWGITRPKRGAINPAQIKKNVYRVLLTRGRDGTVIYLPRTDQLENTWNLFVEVLGVQVL